MDGILQFLLIAGIIVIELLSSSRKKQRRTLRTGLLCLCRKMILTKAHYPFLKPGETHMADLFPKVPPPKYPPFRQKKKNINFLLQNIFLEEILQIHLPSIPQLIRNRRFLLLCPLRKNLKPIPNTPFIRQKKHGKPSFGRKYYNGSIE